LLRHAAKVSAFRVPLLQAPAIGAQVSKTASSETPYVRMGWFDKKKQDTGDQVPAFPQLLGGNDTTKSGYKRISQAERIDRMIEAAAGAAESKGDNFTGLATCLRVSKPFLTFFWKVLDVVAKLYIYLFKWLIYFYHWAPKNLLILILGVALCFFGGAYAATFAAVEAFRKMGWERFYDDFLVVKTQALAVQNASAEDDDQDKNWDGIADVDQLTPSELLKRKAAVAMQAVEQPKILESAVANLWGAYIAVLATLKLQFAATVAIAVGIAEMVKLPFASVLVPVLSNILGQNLKHWASTIIDTVVNIIAVVFAWQLQMIVSSFYSALRGGKLIGGSIFGLLNDFVIPNMPGSAPSWAKIPLDVNSSYVDDIIGYIFFAIGFASQLRSWFDVPFPLDIVLLPVTAFEYFLRYEITFGDAASGGWPPLK